MLKLQRVGDTKVGVAGRDSFSPTSVSQELLHILLAKRILVQLLAPVQRCPFRLVLKQSHCVNILYTVSIRVSFKLVDIWDNAFKNRGLKIRTLSSSVVKR